MGNFERDMCEQQCLHPQTIRRAQSKMLDEDSVMKLADIFKVLGDPTRIKVLDVLSKQEMCVCDIAAALQMGQSAISHQLRVLRGARLVKYRRDGKEAWYSLDDEHVLTLFHQGLEHVNHI